MSGNTLHRGRVRENLSHNPYLTAGCEECSRDKWFSLLARNLTTRGTN